jgi:Poxvirus A32 protein
MEIINFSKEYQICSGRPHSSIFPKNIFAVIAGSTGSGKTNLIINLLRQEKLLNYDDVYIYSSSLHQPAYQYLKQFYTDLERLMFENENKTIKIAQFFDADSQVMNPSELDTNKNHIMIFDDVMMEDQSVIKKYFCQGRHSNVNVFYLCQSLYKIAKHCIRENANIFILFKQDDKTLKYFHETHISGDMEFKEFKNFCDGAWSRKHGFVVINIWDEAYCGRYLSNYDQIFIPKKYLA